MQFVSVQYLRGLAALAVVLHHASVQLSRLQYYGWHPEFLVAGVDVFFVISGFIMWVTTEKVSMSAASFYKKRLVRVAPLYWIFTTVVVGTALLAPSVLQSTKLEAWHAVASYFFVPLPSPSDGLMYPILVPGWTLNYEMFFYLVFGACLFLPPVGRFIAVTGVICALVMLGLVLNQGSGPVSFWTSTILFEFVFGMIIGWLALRLKLPLFISLGLVLIGIIVLAASNSVNLDHWRFVSFGLPAMLLVAGCVATEKAGLLPKVSILRLMGDSSYSLYLSHGLVLSALTQIWKRFPFKGIELWSSYLLVAVITSIIVGLVIYRFIELPLSRMLTTSVDNRKAVPA